MIVLFSDYCDFALPSKGGWENDETVEQAAVREAIEEAGVRGDLMVKDYSTFYELIKFLSSAIL